MATGLSIGVGVFVAILFFRMFFRSLEDFGENFVHFLIGAWLWSDPLSTTRQDPLFSGLKMLVYLLMVVGSGCLVYYFLK
jgi:hypothetical protein